MGNLNIYCNFFAEFNCEIIFLIGQHLPKLCLRLEWLLFDSKCSVNSGACWLAVLRTADFCNTTRCKARRMPFVLYQNEETYSQTFSPSGSPIILAFQYQTLRQHSNMGVKIMKVLGIKKSQFSIFLALSRK